MLGRIARWHHRKARQAWRPLSVKEVGAIVLADEGAFGKMCIKAWRETSTSSRHVPEIRSGGGKRRGVLFGGCRNRMTRPSQQMIIKQ